MSPEKGSDRSHAGPALQFCERLRQLDRGERAALHRNAGNTVAESRDVLGLFYRILPLPIAGSRAEEVYFLVATLFDADLPTCSGDFGSTMRQVRTARAGGNESEAGGGGLDRRMSILLDSEFGLADGRPGGGEFPFRLRQCVKLAAASGVGIDWPRLLEHLTFWQHPDRWVQKRWARSYYGESHGSEEASQGGQV